MSGDNLWMVFIALAPTVGVLFLFYHVMKGILEGDRRERIAHAQWEREHERAGSSPTSGTPAGTSPGHSDTAGS